MADLISGLLWRPLSNSLVAGMRRRRILSVTNVLYLSAYAEYSEIVFASKSAFVSHIDRMSG